MSSPLRPEIMAPVGGMDSLIAAVRCGADSVYFGAKILNARRNAGNFDEEALPQAVAYAHERGCRVALTVNISVFDEELRQAAALISLAAESGVDALIVTDLAVISLCRRIAPSLPLYGSTQMAIHTPEGAKELQRLGLSRVVLARELEKDEISRIISSCSIETELFVHGALCMCLSGQCYLSSMIGGRSGNRGLCAQPCRLPFFLPGTENALSLKDLSLIDRCGELAQLGITALKIEGRMKRPEYVAAAVTALRAARAGNPDPQHMEALSKIFSRSGFTSGYFDGKRGRDMFGFRRKEDVTAAAEVLAPLAALYQNETPLVGVSMHYSIAEDRPCLLTLSDEDGHTVTVTGEIPTKAQTAPLTSEKIASRLQKTGGTPYYAKKTEGDLAQGVFLPAAAVNDLRRRGLEALSQARSVPPSHAVLAAADDLCFPLSPVLEPSPYRADSIRPSSDYSLAPSRPALRLFVPSAEHLLSQELWTDAAFFYLPLEEVLRRKEALLPLRDRLILTLPRLAFKGESHIIQQLSVARRAGFSHGAAAGISQIRILREQGFAIHGLFPLNIHNHLSAAEYRDLGCCDAVLSPELSCDRIRTLLSLSDPTFPLGIVGYGRLPLMVFRNCPGKAFGGCHPHDGWCDGPKDRLGNRFPLRCEGEGSELLNCLPISVSGRLAALPPVSFLVLRFTVESPMQMREIVAHFQKNQKLPFPVTGGLLWREVL